MLDIVGRAFFNNQHRLLAADEFGHLFGHDGKRHIQYQQRESGLAKRIRQTALLQRAPQRIGQPALHDDAQRTVLALVQFVETMRHDIATRRRNTFIDLALFMLKRDRRVGQSRIVKRRRLG